MTGSVAAALALGTAAAGIAPGRPADGGAARSELREGSAEGPSLPAGMASSGTRAAAGSWRVSSSVATKPVSAATSTATSTR